MNGVPDIYPNPSKPIPITPIKPPITPNNTTPDIQNKTKPVNPSPKIIPNPSPIVIPK
jgi:hypothetical protein